MATTNSNPGESGDDAVLHDFGPLLRVYKSGRLDRPLTLPPVPPGHDASTGVTSKDVTISSASVPFTVRLYLPDLANLKAQEPPAGAKLPVVIYFHGGGFVAESAASPGYHLYLNSLAAAASAVAVSVDYRLAPEHPLPAAYDDAYAALEWVLSATDPWLAAHGDVSRVFLAGDSAGGNIVHHLALKTTGTKLKGAILIHPWFWGKEAVGEETRDPAARVAAGRLWEFACPDAVEGVDDPRMNPTAADAPGLDNLSCEKVLVCVGETDFLKWRGNAYAEAATAAATASGGWDGKVEFLESEGEGHVFYLFKPGCEKAKEMMEKVVAFIRGE